MRTQSISLSYINILYISRKSIDNIIIIRINTFIKVVTKYFINANNIKSVRSQTQSRLEKISKLTTNLNYILNLKEIVQSMSHPPPTETRAFIRSPS